MDASKTKASSLALSPFSSPNVGALLKIKINAWAQETGLPVSVRVQVGDRIFDLHKYPLISKSGYLKKAFSESTDIKLPYDFPGGSEAFEMVALFSYGASALIDPFNVASLRCAAEFLEMTEAHSQGNLCERADLYLIQVVLQNWDDTLIVLQKCQLLLPLSEELLIVSRCVESLAFMACMEILDPDRRRDRPIVTLGTLNSQPWSSELVKELSGQDLWSNLISLPFRFFKRIIGSLRRQGMKEKYVSPIVIFYANKWVLSKETGRICDNAVDTTDNANNETSIILLGILDLLPMGEKVSRPIPVGFYFALISRALDLGLRSDTRTKLQNQIAATLHLATVDDFLFPKGDTESISSSVELATMANIVSTSVLSNATKTGHGPSDSNSIVAELWDKYLFFIAVYPKMGSQRFMDLIEEETCIEAVQNDLMPLRLIVQALFVQQLHTHQAFKECSDSFRYAHCGDFSGSIPSSRCPDPKSQVLGETPSYETGEVVVRPLGFLLQKDIVTHSSELSKKDYESTSFRIHNLEQELMSLKKSLQWKSISNGTELPLKPPNTESYGLEKRSLSKSRNPMGQVTSCIGSVSFASQRKYASRLLKVVRRISLYGKTKSKRKTGASGRPK
ncbi:hypothetical protein IFM89_022371 [Coptis chinensis]|uniref:Phototropic-responsive NPH3 family protein n=1 Tax=Coptis chinensis TaxID=261450 RepID=A0A835LJ70_9MAGN|nr:hypothetical protein IFM89_022371 [Coptis chinensis]